MKTVTKAIAILTLAAAGFAFAPNVKISFENSSAQACPANHPLCGHPPLTSTDKL